ncbi:hypothetical protein ACS3SW_15630 [Roseobacteraceae bacterium S113]
MFKKTILAAALIASASSMAQADVPDFFRGICKDVYIQAINNTGELIDVVDIDFMVSGYGLKSEPTPNQEVPTGEIFAVTRNLEDANERNTQIIIKYRVATGNKYINKWGPLLKAKSEYQECKENKSFIVKID